jgi:hypothetical protein
VTEEDGFGVDRSKASGRKSHCRECDRRRGRTYYRAHRAELYAQREAVREAARQAYLKRLEKEHRKRIAAVKKEHEAGVRRQKELLRSLGVPDLSPEEITASCREGGHRVGSRKEERGLTEPRRLRRQPSARLCR